MGPETFAGLPLIPLTVAVAVMFVTGATGIVALLYDSGARDTGRVTQFGVMVIGIGIISCLGIGLWNVTVATAALVNQQNTFAIASPPRMPHE